jgi:bleomycin hydrolase
MQKYNLTSFELSQAYLFFYDKLEKANYFLENVLDTLNEPLDGRLVQELLKGPVSDGGQWDMVANLVEKYGLVPQSLYPDSFNAKSSGAMSKLITSKLREDCLRLRSLAKSPSVTRASDIAAAKQKMLKEVHLILTLMLGPPPSPTREFTWDYTDKNSKFHSVRSTPVEFARQLSDPKTVRACGGTDVHRLFSLVNDPRNEYMTLLGVERLGNVWKGRPITYVNVPMDVMKAACIAMIRSGFPVFFGSDVGKDSDSARGVMHKDMIDYEAGFNVRLGMSKAERLTVSESAMTHAMVLTAVHVVDGRPVRWRVENSWSEASGTEGYFCMTDAWMDEFVYQAVVDPSFVSAEVRAVLKQKPTMLPLWDPMGECA